MSSLERLMLAVLVGPGDVELGPPEHATAIVVHARRATSARRIVLRIRGR